MQNTRHWQLTRDAEDIAWLTIYRADESTNTLSREVIEELDTLLDELAANLPKGLVIQSGKESGFIAGADIREFEAFDNASAVTEEVKRGH
ncbi:MAG: fatty-acid oxidation protein subunit alpha, partial [Pseudomonadota bacterium]